MVITFGYMGIFWYKIKIGNSKFSCLIQLCVKGLLGQTSFLGIRRCVVACEVDRSTHTVPSFSIHQTLANLTMRRIT